MKAWQVGLALWLLGGPVPAVMHQDAVSYQDGDVKLRGYVYWDDAFTGQRPGVMVVHEWWGLNDYAKLRAEMLAEMGYVAFAADMYGEGRMTRHAEDAKSWMQQITANADAWQRRALAGLEQLKVHPKVDAARLAAIGYCFGGATVMQMAYAGAEVQGVVSFHGALPPATPEQAARVKPRVLVAHGDADSFVPPERVQAFTSALSAAGVDWEMNVYAGAKHAFTNPYADGYGMAALGYQEAADRRSWLRMLAFFEDIFAEPL